MQVAMHQVGHGQAQLVVAGIHALVIVARARKVAKPDLFPIPVGALRGLHGIEHLQETRLPQIGIIVQRVGSIVIAADHVQFERVRGIGPQGLNGGVEQGKSAFLLRTPAGGDIAEKPQRVSRAQAAHEVVQDDAVMALHVREAAQLGDEWVAEVQIAREPRGGYGLRAPYVSWVRSLR